MAVRRRIGEALSGFAESFLPAWQQQEYLKRLERGEARQGRRDLAADLASEQGLLRSEFGTQDDVEAALSRILDVNPGADPDMVRSALEGALLSDERRAAALYRQLDESKRPHMPPESIMAQAPGFGLTREAFQQATSLPSRSLTGVLEGYPGAEVPPQLMAPLEITEEAPEPTGAWGGPVAEQFEALQAGEREAQEAAAAFQRDTLLRLEDERARQNERLAAEFHDATVTRLVDGQVKLLEAGVPFEEASLDRATKAAYMDDVRRAKSGGELFEAALSLQRARVAIDATFGKPAYAVIRNDAGELESAKVEWVPGVLPDSGRYEVVGLGEYLGDEFHPHMMNSMNWLRELLPANLMAQVEASVGLASPMDTATPPGPPADVGGELPPVSPEVLAATEQKFYGPAVEDQQPAGSSLPIDEMQRILGGTDTSVMGTREVGPGLSGLTINPRQIFGGPAPRDLLAFLRQEGVVDWLSNQAVSDPQITHEMIQALLRIPEGLELLQNAWDTR